MKKLSPDKKMKIKNQLPSWLNFQNFLFLIVILIFIIIIVWSDSFSQYFEQSNGYDDDPSITATTLPGTPTPLPEEWLSSSQQTNGIILGAMVIIIAITAGSAVILIRDRER